MADENMFHQRKFDTEADLIVNHIKHDELDKARTRLAEDYLTMKPSDFKKVLNEVKELHNAHYDEQQKDSAPVRKIYGNQCGDLCI